MFTESEIKAIWRMFGLHVDELLPESRFRGLLGEIERLDNRYGLSLVAEVRSLLTQIDAIDADLASANANIRRETVDGEYTIEYGDGGKSAEAVASRKSLIGRLLYIIDPTLSLQGQFGHGHVYAS
jgi:hypothetical protein